jgi:hypothetical protein
VMDVFLTVYTAMAATVLASNPMMNLYSMFNDESLQHVSLQVSSNYSKFELQKDYMCTSLSSFDEQFELFITHRQNVGTQ